MAADGSIIIDSRIRDDGFIAGTKELEAAMKRTAATIQGLGEKQKAALQKQVSSFSQLNQQYAEQSRKVEELTRQINELGRQEVETKEYAAVNKEIDDLANKIAAAEAKKRKFLSTGGTEASTTFQKMEYDTNLLSTAMDRALEKKKQLEASGGAYKFADTSALEAELTAEQARLAQTGTRLDTSYVSLKANLSSYSSQLQNASKSTSIFKTSTQKLSNILKRLLSTLSGFAKKGLSAIASGAKKAGSALLGMGNNASKSDGGLKSSLKTMIRYGFGVESLFALVRKLRTALVDGMKNLAAYSDSANASISAMQSSVTTLKNSVAAAFAPILDIVAPVVTSLINLLSTAISYIGAFFAALSGKSTYTKAIGVQENFAGSLNDTAAAASGASGAMQDYLSGLDEIKKFDDGSGGGGGGGGGASAGSTGAMFEEAQIPGLATDWAAKFKEAWREADFTEIGGVVGQKLQNALDNIPWTDIKLSCYRVAQSVGTFINGFVETEGLFDSMGSTIAQGINTAVGTVHTFLNTVNWESVGTAISNGANAIVNKVNWKNLGNTFGKKFEAVFDVLKTAVSNFDWVKLGTSIGSSLQSAWNSISWADLAQTLSTGTSGAFDAIRAAIAAINWNQVGLDVKAFLVNIDWSGVAQSMFSAIGAAIGGIGTFIWSVISEKVTAAKDHFAAAIELCGGDLVAGILVGIGQALKSIYTWIKDNIFGPFIDGFKSVFGIHSPSTIMQEQGGYIIEGLLQGLKEKFEDVKEWFTGIKDSVVEAFQNLPETVGNIFQSGKDLATGAWSKIKEFFTGKSNEAADGLSSFTKSAKKVSENSYTGVGDAWESVESDFSEIAQEIENSFNSLENGIYNKFNAAYQSAIRAWDTSQSDFLRISQNIVNAFNTLSSGVSEKFKDALTQAKSAWSQASSGFHSISNEVIAGFSTLPDGIEIKFNSAFTSAKKAWATATSSFQGVSTDVISGFSSLPDEIKRKFENALSAAQSLGWSGLGYTIVYSTVSGMYNTGGVSDWASWYKSQIGYYLTGGSIGYNLTLGIVYGMYTTDGLGDWASWFISEVKSRLGIHSPSKLFKEEVGFFLGAGIGEGLLSSTRSVLNNVSTLAEKIVDGFTQGLSELTIPNAVTGVFPNISIPTPALATGTIIPPKTVYTQDVQNVGQTLSGLSDALQRLTGGTATNSNTYNFTAQINRRTLFEEMIDEARMVQSQTGINPFGL